MKQNNRKEGDEMNTTIQRPITPAESLKESLQQMNLIREGKLPKKTWRQLREELNKEE